MKQGSSTPQKNAHWTSNLYQITHKFLFLILRCLGSNLKLLTYPEEQSCYTLFSSLFCSFFIFHLFHFLFLPLFLPFFLFFCFPFLLWKLSLLLLQLLHTGKTKVANGVEFWLRQLLSAVQWLGYSSSVNTRLGVVSFWSWARSWNIIIELN